MFFSPMLMFLLCLCLISYVCIYDSCQNTSEHVQENVEKVKNWDSEKLLDFQKNINQERINNLIIELSRPGDDMTPHD
jgi:hypothetical protein